MGKATKQQPKPKRRHATSGMTSDRYRVLIEKLGLSQRAAGRFLGVSNTQAARMALGTVAIPPPIALLLELMVARAVRPEAVLKLLGIDVRARAKQARSEQPIKQPRFYS